MKFYFQPSSWFKSEAFINLERITILTFEITDKMKRAVGYRNVAVHNYAGE